MSNKLRIIGGQWRSRILGFEALPGLRPTPNRIRETLFNWLQYDIAGSQCLDLFAGSGALGFEAASRGAAKVLLVEQAAKHCQHLHTNAALLHATQITIYQQNVLAFLTGEVQACDVVFMDPPFNEPWVPTVCQILETRGWLNQAAKIYIEVPANARLTDLPGTWQCVRHKIAGAVGAYLLQRHC